ncbi:tRNA glutamyl-Q(34) synthetase GluQRS [uncultured Pelagimonas sp.]|uniref:tRNA glutamyl-Q(34) synthetase GluQRS n=1 Tax=uncultured Pelagimonas sp. TaxID=1618102 RepID=UPI00262567FA|nr:tRNA glutamyl-Q(34) synthetase GluQRS [uncultured Pelagimonas sp.]
MNFVTRFAPSPTGPLHLGHAFSALLAHDTARAVGGQFLLRIDDLDQTRARSSWEDLIYEDLEWLGIRWHGPVRKQSNHFEDYQDAINNLANKGLIYPCRCKRRDIEVALDAPQEGVPRFGPDGLIYPGTCRNRSMQDRQSGDALRLDLSKATLVEPLAFTETGQAHLGTHHVTIDHLQTHVGDPVIARSGMAASYHLAVVIDDAASGITHAIRGEDLFEASYIQRLLQAQLNLPPIKYHHHPLVRDDNGKRLAKRDDARAISKYRADGATPEDIRKMVGL